MFPQKVPKEHQLATGAGVRLPGTCLTSVTIVGLHRGWCFRSRGLVCCPWPGVSWIFLVLKDPAQFKLIGKICFLDWKDFTVPSYGYLGVILGFRTHFEEVHW